MRMRKRKGFTLIELLIVMAVIAALIATLTPVAVNAVKKAKATQVATNLRNLAVAAQQYMYTEQSAPSGKSQLLSSGYIDKDPGDKYSVSVSGPDTDGKYTITASYDNSGGDVDTTMVQNIDPGISVSGNNITYVATVVKFW